MIEWKTTFYGWKEVTPEQAKRLVANAVSNSAMDREKLIQHINKNRLRGITVEELFKENNNDN